MTSHYIIQSNLPLATARYDPHAVVGGIQGGDSSAVAVVHHVHLLARLRSEAPDLTVLPSRQDRLTVLEEEMNLE